MKSTSISLENQAVSYIDWKLLGIVLGLLIIGLVSLFSATGASGMEDSFNRQIISIGFGVFGALVLTFLPPNIMRYTSILFYTGSILLLLAVLFVGEEIYGTRGWIRFGGMSLQPAELSKFGVITMLGYFLSSKGTDITNIRDFSISAIIILIPFSLVFLQPDHGTSSVLAALFLGILFWSGFSQFALYFLISIPFIIIFSLKGFWFSVSGVVIFTAITLFFKNKVIYKVLLILFFLGISYIAPNIYENLKDHQKARIETFLNPGADPRGQGYNVIQSMMAVGSGGLTGKGLMQGTQTQLRYIPMQWTDFIFSVPAEEFGFMGSSALVLLFGFLLLRTLNIAYEADDRFYSVASFGIFSVFLYHILINIGMVLGLVPVMGIPLPFLSYGGTSMIVNFAFVGFLLNSYRNYRRKRLV